MIKKIQFPLYKSYVHIMYNHLCLSKISHIQKYVRNFIPTKLEQQPEQYNLQKFGTTGQKTTRNKLKTTDWPWKKKKT